MVSPVPGQAVLGNVLPVEQDLPLGGAVQAAQQREQGWSFHTQRVLEWRRVCPAPERGRRPAARGGFRRRNGHHRLLISAYKPPFSTQCGGDFSGFSVQDGQSSQRDGYAEDGSPHPEQAGDGSRGDGDHNLRQAGLGFKLGAYWSDWAKDTPSPEAVGAWETLGAARVLSSN